MPKIKVSQSFTRAQFDVNSYNAESNTIDVVFATETPVRRYDWQNGRYFNEVLGISDEEIDFTRLESGAPVLDTHSRYSISDIIGVVTKAWVKDGEARATLHFSDREELKPIINDIKNGIIRNISCGYNVRKFQVSDIDPQSDEIPTYRAIDWQPTEISFVPVPADPQSGTRSDDNNQREVILIQNNTEIMKNNGQRSEGTAPTTVETPAENVPATQRATTPVNDNPAPVLDETAIREEAMQAERTRSAEITTAVRKANLPVNIAEKLIAEGKSIDEARTAIIDELAKNSTHPSSGFRAEYNGDESGNLRAELETAVMYRIDNSTELKSERSKDFRNASLTDIAGEILESKGQKVRGLTKSEITERALTTSDFPNLLANIANKVLRKAYTQAPSNWKKLASQMDARDFKSVSGIQVDGSLAFDKVQEDGEYKYGTLKESKETFKLDSYGKIVKISRQAIINDDLNGFSRLSILFGRAAANLESSTVWNLLLKNPVMGDGKNVFHTAHNNLLTGAASALSASSLSAARILLSKQTGLAGKATEVLNLMPVYLVVPLELQTTAQQLMTSIYANKTTDVNVFNGAFEIITDAHLTDANAWYLTTDPTQIDMLQYGYLEGQGLRTETRLGFNVDGVEVKAALDFGASIWDYRGFVKSNGQ